MTEYIINQTDERMFLLAQDLNERTPKTNTWIFAPNIVLSLDNVIQVQSGEMLIGGKTNQDASDYIKAHDINYYNILDNQTFQTTNSMLTAEGVLSVVLSHSLLSVKECRFLVIGFGRCGSAITRILRGVGAKSVDVATKGSIRQASAFADNIVPIGEFDFSSYNIVINTVPQSIIADKEVLTFSQGAIYIDIASKPALSLCFAKYIGIDADIYPALPAKITPQSAANAIKSYVLEVAE